MAVMRAVSRRDHDLPPPRFAGGLGAPAPRPRHRDAKRPSARRLAKAERELAWPTAIDYQVVNDDMDQAVQEICEILTSQWEKIEMIDELGKRRLSTRSADGSSSRR